MGWPRFPLPESHCFANVWHERCHTGEDVLDRVRLRAAQQRLRSAWGMKTVDPGSMYDGPTATAVAAVQHTAHLPVTGWLDKETWDTIFAGPSGPDQDP